MGGLVAKLNLVTTKFSGFLTYPFGIYLEKNKAIGTALFHSEEQIWHELVAGDTLMTMRP